MPPDFVDHLAELRDRFDDLSSHQLRPSEADATLKGLGRVADRLGEIKPLFSCGAGTSTGLPATAARSHD